MSSLLSVQDNFGYIPEVAIETVAIYMDVSIKDVWSVASFYKNLALKQLFDIIKIKKKFINLNYKHITCLNLHSQEISNHVAFLAKQKKVREIMRIFQKKIIGQHHQICCEGRDQASTILRKNPRYDVAFYFRCNLNTASLRRWRDLKKKIPLKEVKKSLRIRTLLDKKRRHNPLIKVADAVLIRTDILNKKAVVEKMSKKIDRKLLLKYGRNFKARQK